LTSPDTTTTPAPEPANAAQAAAAVAQEAADGGAHLAGLADRAKEIRGTNYAGSLTPTLLIELGELLRQPTPGKYVKYIPAVNPGKPYPSIGLNSSQFQIDAMNAVLGRPHWRILRHYPDGKDGFICKVVVIVGNQLAAASLDYAGELIAGDAEILAISEEWGAVKNATTPADAYKGSATNACKRAIAGFGPGADVYRKDFEDENVGGTGHMQAPGAGQQHGSTGGGAVRQPSVASDKQQKMLRGRASCAGLDDAQLANVILWAAGQQQRQFDSLQNAAEYLGRLLAALPGNLVDPVLTAIESIKQQAQSGQPTHPAAAAQGLQHVRGSDIASDVAPIAPVAVPAANGNGALPPGQAA
jgi:hypothetical protein